MRISSQFGFILGGAAIVASLAGCSGGGSTLPAATVPVSPLSQSVQTVQGLGVVHDTIASMRRPAMSQSRVGATQPRGFVNVAGVNALHGNQTIISEIAFNTVSVYGANGQLNALLTIGLSEPQGLATDALEKLYVANTLKNDVFVYSKPYISPGLTLNDTNEYPVGVAVSGTGIVGVTNIGSVTGGFGNVSFYTKHSTVPCANVSDPNWQRVLFDAFDASGNLFIDGQDAAGNALVGEVSGGCKATSIATLGVGNTIIFPGGVQVENGNILIDDQGVPAIYTYAPPSGGSLGSPTATTTLIAGTDPVTFAMMKGGLSLWTANTFTLPGGYKYTYPGGLFLKSITDGFLAPIGIAVNPAAKP